jgi:hypothetical protein
VAQADEDAPKNGINTRWLGAIMFVQICFVGALIFVGQRSRENRKSDYLELTHRATAGEASMADFEKLAAFLPEKADKTEVRAVFGLPVLRATKVEIAGEKPETLSGEIWLYYAAPGHAEHPVDSADAEKLSGPVDCFLVRFDERGRAKARRGMVVHPVGK